MITARIKELLEACESGNPSFPPTTLFGEGWLLRVIIDWFANHGGDRYPLSPQVGARWFAEAWLPSAFLARYRGDELAESRTHADAAVGHFRIGDPGTSSGLTLEDDARQLVIVEAKLFNRFSSGVKNARFFDQAARSVACLAEILRRSVRNPREMTDLALLVIAPQNRIEDGVFARDTAIENIRQKVIRRVEQYGGERTAWLEDWFEPTLDQVEVRCLAWEELIETIAFHDPTAGQLIDSFYAKCLLFNHPRERSAFPGSKAGANRPWTDRKAEAVAYVPFGLEPRQLEPSRN